MDDGQYLFCFVLSAQAANIAFARIPVPDNGGIMTVLHSKEDMAWVRSQAIAKKKDALFAPQARALRPSSTMWLIADERSGGAPMAKLWQADIVAKV